MDNTKQWIRCNGFKCPHLPNTCTSSLQYQAQIATDMDNKNSALRQPTQTDAIAALVDALQDCSAGLAYVRQHYGELSGVGFDRALSKATAALESADA